MPDKSQIRQSLFQTDFQGTCLQKPSGNGGQTLEGQASWILRDGEKLVETPPLTS